VTATEANLSHDRLEQRERRFLIDAHGVHQEQPAVSVRARNFRDADERATRVLGDELARDGDVEVDAPAFGVQGQQRRSLGRSRR
jgi:hypothetical protein